METKTSTRARVISLVVIALFAAAAVLSAMFMNTVAINYNLADYLGADTQTKIALDIIDEEFGMTGSIQVMVRNVTPDRAEELADEIKALPNVLNVNFDKYDTAYYKEDKLTFDQFVSFADELLQNDADALEFADADTSKTVGMMNTVAQLMADELTADELYDRLTTGAMEGTDVQLSSIRQLYGMYFCQDVPEQAVDFQTMLSFLIAYSQTEDALMPLDAQTLAQLTALRDGITQFTAQMEQPLDQQTFRLLLAQNYGVNLPEMQAAQIYALYFAASGEEAGETIPFLPLMKFLASQGILSDPKCLQIYEENLDLKTF